ncbi:MAG: O-antigen ligase family protein, partial [Candidatus Rokuibacteriota bacterium]
GWDLLLACVAVYIATAVGRVHQVFPVLLPLKPALVAAVLAIGLYLLQQSGPRRVGLLRSPTTACLLGLVLWSALSVPGALNRGVAFQFVTDFVNTVLMYFVIAGSVRNVRDVERLIFVYVGVTVVYTVVVLSRFQLGADSWRLGRLYNYDANDFATLIASAMPFGLYFALGQRRPLVRLAAIVGLVMLAVGMIRSGSRGGFLALLAVAAFVLLRFTTIPARSRLVGLVVILAVIFATASDQYWTQMQTIVQPRQDYNLTSDAGRTRIWKRGLGYLADNPVLGVGANNFWVAEGTASPLAKLQERGIGVRWGAAHNSFIQAGAELGIPGLLLFIGFIASAFASLHRLARQSTGTDPADRDVPRLAQGLMAGLVGFVVGGFFLSLAYSDMLYTLVALAVALKKIARADAARSRPLPRRAQF